MTTLRSQTNGRLEVRASSSIPSSGFNCFDVSSPRGLVCVQHYEYHPSGEPAPVFTLESQDGPWFQHFASEAERLWEAGTAWPLSPGQQIARTRRPVFSEAFGPSVKLGCPTVITYADDFVCHSREETEAVQTRIGAWLNERGLSLNKEKTRIGRIDAGFDFLSFTIRRYHVHGGTKVITKPSRDALKKIRRRTADELRALRGASPVEVIGTMNPITRGQANDLWLGGAVTAILPSVLCPRRGRPRGWTRRPRARSGCLPSRH